MVNRKYNTEKFILESNIVHSHKYCYDKTVFNTVDEKVIITCLVHGDFEQLAISHIKGKGCQICGKIKSARNRLLKNASLFAERALKVHGNIYDYSKVDYIGAGHEVEIICNIDGPFFVTPNGHLQGRGCQKCGRRRGAEGRAITEEEFLIRAHEVHEEVYDYSNMKYINLQTKIEIYCKKHKEKFWQYPRDHLREKGCPKCGVERRAALKTKTRNKFIEEANIMHNCFYIYDLVNYKHGREKVIIICPNHGQFLQTPEGHLSGRGCRKCVGFISKKETDWLNSLGIPDNKEHRNVTLKISDKIVRVDGFDPMSNTVYEFHGKYWHGDPAVFAADKMNLISGKTFGELYQKTLERESVIKSGGYNLVTMWESEYDKLSVTPNAE